MNHTIIYNSRKVITKPICNLHIYFKKQIPIILKNTPKLYEERGGGGSCEVYKGDHIIYDSKNMIVGNIKQHRYTYLQKNFCDYYNIENVDYNDHTRALWFSEINEVLLRNPVKSKRSRRTSDLYNHLTIDNRLLNTLVETLKLKTFVNFNALNVPIKFDHMNYVSKYDNRLGSIENKTQLDNCYIKCCYSPSNIMQYIKTIGDSMMIDPTKPIRNLITIPITNGKTLEELTKHYPFQKLLAIIPKNTMYLQTSDHWFDVEHTNVLNKYPIAVCLYYNEASLMVNPIDKIHLEKIEESLNKTLLHKDLIKVQFHDINAATNNTHINEEDLEVVSKELVEVVSKELVEVVSKDVIYTDACIKTINHKIVSSIGVWCGPNDSRNISQRIDSYFSNDINFCELVAIYVALINGNPNADILIYTDSLTSLKLINEGSISFENVNNIKYKEIISIIIQFIRLHKHHVKLMKIKAHQGYVGNENADIMAKMGAYKKTIVIDNLTELRNKMMSNVKN